MSMDIEGKNDIKLNIEKKEKVDLGVSKIKNIASYFQKKTLPEANIHRTPTKKDSISELTNPCRDEQKIFNIVTESTGQDKAKSNTEISGTLGSNNDESVIVITDNCFDGNSNFSNRNNVDLRIVKGGEIGQCGSDVDNQGDITGNDSDTCLGSPKANNDASCDMRSPSSHDDSVSTLEVTTDSCAGSENKNDTTVKKVCKKTGKKWRLTWKGGTKKSKKKISNVNNSDSSDFDDDVKNEIDSSQDFEKFPAELVPFEPAKHVPKKPVELEKPLELEKPEPTQPERQDLGKTEKPVESEKPESVELEKLVSVEPEKQVVTVAEELVVEPESGTSMSQGKPVSVEPGKSSMDEEKRVIEQEEMFDVKSDTKSRVTTSEMENLKKRRAQKKAGSDKQESKKKSKTLRDKNLKSALFIKDKCYIDSKIDTGDTDIAEVGLSEVETSDTQSLQKNGSSGKELSDTGCDVLLDAQIRESQSKIDNTVNQNERRPKAGKSAFDVLMKGSREQAVSLKMSTSDSTDTEILSPKTSGLLKGRVAKVCRKKRNADRKTKSKGKESVVGSEVVADDEKGDCEKSVEKGDGSKRKSRKQGVAKKLNVGKGRGCGKVSISPVKPAKRNKRKLEYSDKDDEDETENEKGGKSVRRRCGKSVKSDDDTPVKQTKRSKRKVDKLKRSDEDGGDETENEKDGKSEKRCSGKSVKSDDDTPVKQTKRSKRKVAKLKRSDEDSGDETENEKDWKSERRRSGKSVKSDDDTPVKQTKRSKRKVTKLEESDKEDGVETENGKSNGCNEQSKGSDDDTPVKPVKKSKRKVTKLEESGKEDVDNVGNGKDGKSEKRESGRLKKRQQNVCPKEKVLNHDEDAEKGRDGGGKMVSACAKMKPSPKKMTGPIAPIFLPGAWRKAKQKLKEEEELHNNSIMMVDVDNANDDPTLDSNAQTSIVTIDDESPHKEQIIIQPYSPIKNAAQNLQAFMGLFKPVVMKNLVVVKLIAAPFPKVSHVRQVSEDVEAKWKLPIVSNRFVKEEFFNSDDNHPYNYTGLPTCSFLIVRPSQMIDTEKCFKSFKVPEMSKLQTQRAITFLKMAYNKVPVKKLFKRCRIQLQRCEKELLELETLNTERQSTISRLFQQQSASSISQQGSKTAVNDDTKASKPFTNISKKNALKKGNKKAIKKVSPLLAAFKKQSESTLASSNEKNSVPRKTTDSGKSKKQPRRKTSLRDYLNVSGGKSDGISMNTNPSVEKVTKKSNVDKLSSEKRVTKRTRSGKSQRIEDIFARKTATGQSRKSTKSSINSLDERCQKPKVSGLRGKGCRKVIKEDELKVVDAESLGSESGKENVKKREREVLEVEKTAGGPLTKKAKLVKDQEFVTPSKRGRKRKDSKASCSTVVIELSPGGEIESGSVKKKSPKLSSGDDFKTATSKTSSKRSKKAKEATTERPKIQSPSEGTRKSSRLRRKIEEAPSCENISGENLGNDVPVVEEVSETGVSERKEEGTMDGKSETKRRTRSSVKEASGQCKNEADPENETEGKCCTEGEHETQNISKTDTKLEHENESRNETDSKKSTHNESETHGVNQKENAKELKSEPTVSCTRCNPNTTSPQDVEPRSPPVLWTECFKPGRSDEVLGNISSGNKLKNWLKEWRNLREKKLSKKRRHRAKKRERLTMPKTGGASEWWYEDDEDSDFDLSDDSNGSYSDDEEALCNTMLITGPTGCGKTSAVYACAKELGFKVLEVNSSTKRGGKYILTEFQEATQSHQVSRKRHDKDHVTSASLTSTGNDVSTSEKPENRKRGRKKKEQRERHDKSEKNEGKTSPETDIVHVKMSLILLDEVDVLFDDDKGFWAAVNSLRLNSKRPIVMTSSDHVENIDGIFEHIVLKTPGTHLHAAYLQTVCLSKDVFVNPSDIQTLVTLYNGDVRRSLHNLQFWVDSRAGACDPEGCDRVGLDQLGGCDVKMVDQGFEGTMRDQGGCEGTMRDKGGYDGTMRDQGGYDGRMRDQRGCDGTMGDQVGYDGTMRDQGGCDGTMKDKKGCDGTMRDQGGCDETMKDKDGCEGTTRDKISHNQANTNSEIIKIDAKDIEMTEPLEFVEKRSKVKQSELKSPIVPNAFEEGLLGTAVSQSHDSLKDILGVMDQVTEQRPCQLSNKSVVTNSGSENNFVSPDNVDCLQSKHPERNSVGISSENATSKSIVVEVEKNSTTKRTSALTKHCDDDDVISDDVTKPAGMDLHQFYMESVLGLRNLASNSGGVLDLLRCAGGTQNKSNSESSFGYKCSVTSHCQSLGIDVIRCNLATLFPCLFACIDTLSDVREGLGRTETGTPGNVDIEKEGIKNDNTATRMAVGDIGHVDTSVFDDDVGDVSNREPHEVLDKGLALTKEAAEPRIPRRTKDIAHKLTDISLQVYCECLEEISFLDSQLHLPYDSERRKHRYGNWYARVRPGLEEAIETTNGAQPSWKVRATVEEIRGTFEVACLENCHRTFHDGIGKITGHEDALQTPFATLRHGSQFCDECRTSGLFLGTGHEISALRPGAEHTDSKPSLRMTSDTTHDFRPNRTIKITTSAELSKNQQKRAEDIDTVTSCLPDHNQLNRTALALDYVPTLRNICHNESLRQTARIKRRFYHYFDNIGLNLPDSTTQLLAEDAFTS